MAPQWQTGGMSSNGLRDSMDVRNYFSGPGRQNIIPDATSASNKVSSIGAMDSNGLGQISSGSYGPGTLLSSNVEIRNQNIPNEFQRGAVMQNDKRTTFVDYRQTDPVLVNNLRNNPLSIYAVGDAKNAEIPAFFTFIKPDNYNTYNTEPFQEISESTKQLTIDGSPNVSILGLGYQNPFMGITTGIPNANPEFTGKTYGGNDDASAKKYADKLYNSIWTDNYFSDNKVENFGEDKKCQNKALAFASQGYNISNQITNNKMIEWVGDNKHGVDNLPWGPKRITQNPLNQQGGIWNSRNNTTIPVPFGYSNVKNQRGEVSLTPRVQSNPYKYGLPGSLISN